MKMNEEEIWKDFEFIEPTNKFLNLKNEIMENICRRLDRRDSYEACLIHPNWSIAAVKVLWEAPRFDNATQLKKFMNTICHIKRLALLVRDVSLAFQGSVPDYLLPQHSAESTKIVAHPRFLSLLVQQCERINRLTCYGWQLGRVEWERLSILTQNVVHLHVIGEKELNINSFLSRLVSLCLDGCSRLDQIFVANLVHRATQLQELELSLKHTDLRALATISSEGQMMKMRFLTLTGADDFEAGDFNDFLKAFPNLTRFHLCGSVKMNLAIISVALNHFPTLQSLEIRGHPKRGNTMLDCSASELTHMAIQGLDLTESSLQALVSVLPRLEQIHLSHCPDIYSGSLHLLRNSIQRISIESCGRMFPSDVYQLCAQLPQLHQLILIGYPDLMDSVINTYSSSRLSHVIELEARAIQSLVEDAPTSRSLTMLQIHWIAQQLNLTPQAFSNLLSASEKLDLESSVNGSTDSDSTSANFWPDSMENEDILSQKKEVFWKPNEESPTVPWKPKEESPTAPWKPKEERVFDNESWGEPENVVDWFDLRTQGFAHKLIKEQENTKFYCQETYKYSTEHTQIYPNKSWVKPGYQPWYKKHQETSIKGTAKDEWAKIAEENPTRHFSKKNTSGYWKKIKAQKMKTRLEKVNSNNEKDELLLLQPSTDILIDLDDKSYQSAPIHPNIHHDIVLVPITSPKKEHQIEDPFFQTLDTY